MRLLVFVVACYAPHEPNCRLRCGDELQCPDNLQCLDGFCSSFDTVPGACCPSPAPGKLLVDGTWSGFNNGSAACPFARISDAVAAVPGPGTTIIVAAGTYAGESFPIDLRGGTSLIGAGAGVTIVDGIGPYDPAADGGFLKRFLEPWQVSFLIGDPQLPSRLSGVTVRNSSAVAPPAWGLGVVCNRGNTPRTGPIPSPNTVVDHVAVEALYEVGMVVTNQDNSACNLSLVSSTISGSHCGLWSTGYTDALDLPPVALQVGDGSSDGGNQFTQIRDPIACQTTDPQAVPTIQCGNSGSAIYLFGNERQVIIRGNRINSGDIGLVSAPYGTVPEHVVFDDNQLQELRYGIQLHFSSSVDEMNGNQISSCDQAVALYDSSQVRARGNSIVGNKTGVYINANPVGDQRVIDFGTPADPGANRIHCNSSLNMSATGFDVGLQLQAPNGTLWLAGNFWDHLPPSLSAEQTFADGTDIVDQSASPRPTLVLDGAQLADDACPLGRSR
jgi:parallel beta-helix repeat protein